MKKRKTLAQKLGVSKQRLSGKIHKIMHEDPSMSPHQAAGKAAGMPRHERKRRR